MQKFVFSFLMILNVISVNAHSIWVESNPNATLNKAHEIKVFFGDPDDITPTEKWFSDLKDFSIEVTAPSGKKVAISDKKQLTDYYTLTFTPTEKGVYVILLKHEVKDIYRKMKITYHSGALVTTNPTDVSDKTLVSKPLQLQMNVQPLKVNKEKSMTLIADGEVKKSEKLVVEDPKTWSKTLYSDEKGKVSFTPLWKGNYQLSYSLSKNQSGEHHGQPFEVDYQVLTIQLNAN